jgi:hypothetical protein
MNTYVSNGHAPLAMSAPTDRCASFAYQFLSKLDLDAKHTDVVVQTIARANDQRSMIDFRDCYQETKVIGAIFMIMRQCNISISTPLLIKLVKSIRKSKNPTSKATFNRYVEFLDKNRKRINPVLVKYGVRPIPRSFKTTSGKAKKLKPLLPEHAALFQ